LKKIVPVFYSNVTVRKCLGGVAFQYSRILKCHALLPRLCPATRKLRGFLPINSKLLKNY
jgi:hypothetical protein